MRCALLRETSPDWLVHAMTSIQIRPPKFEKILKNSLLFIKRSKLLQTLSRFWYRLMLQKVGSLIRSRRLQCNPEKSIHTNYVSFLIFL